MTDTLTFTILGCGSSGGVPRLGGHWGDCDPNNPKNRRQRCSLLVERTSSNGTTTVLVDTSPDLRDIFASAPVDRILVETDAPYLAPPPHRGKRNEPAYTAHTAAKGAEIFGLDYAAFADQTQQNFDRLFSKVADYKVTA